MEGTGTESKVAYTVGSTHTAANLAPSGTFQNPSRMGLDWLVYQVCTVLGAVGGGVGDGDIEVHDCVEDIAMHGNIGDGERMVFLRSRMRQYKGASHSVSRHLSFVCVCFQLTLISLHLGVCRRGGKLRPPQDGLEGLGGPSVGPQSPFPRRHICPAGCGRAGGVASLDG